MDNSPSPGHHGSKSELITWRGTGGSHNDFVGTEAVVDMIGEIMHI